MTTPAPIKIVKMKVNDRGEVLLQLDASPSEEFMEGFRQYWTKPTGSTSSAFDRRVFDRFEGTTIAFRNMPVEEFESNHLGVAKDAVKYANEFVVAVYAKRAEQKEAGERGKNAEHEALVRERDKADRVKFD